MSNADRQKRYRDKKRNAQEPQTVTRVTPERNATIEDNFHIKPELNAYTLRTNAELLNWGPWMNSDELKQAGLKANRVPIPGDFDYKGVA